MGQSDQELIRRWQRGETAAFEELVRRWQMPISRFLARFLGKPELVPDLCQEVFLRVYLAGHTFRADAAFSTWLYRIALNIGRDAGRKLRRQVLPLGHHEPISPAEAIDKRCETQELTTAVAQALSELPEPLREVLVLRHYEGLSFEAMSRLLEVPASTLKSRFTAAIGRLREHLRDHVDQE